MLLKYFYDEKLAHASYMVGCQATGEAIVIDPARNIEPYLEIAAKNDLKIVAATETHIHADYVSGARELAHHVGARLYLSDEGDENWKYQYVKEYDHQLVKQGDSWMVGNIKFDVLHTPGHTPESISIMVTDTAGADKPMGIFTGDFLFVGDVGRPDLLEEAAGIADTKEPGARELFKSLKSFQDLPDYLQIWPAHGAGSACGKSLGAVPSSTLGYEKKFNWAFNINDADTFVKTVLTDQPAPPKYFAVMKRVNKEGPAVVGGTPRVPKLDAKKLADLIQKKAWVVDTRSQEEYAAKHIIGTVGIPLRQRSFNTYAGWVLPYDQPIYLIVDEERLDEAAKDFLYVGLDNIAGYFAPDVLNEWPKELSSFELAQPGEIGDSVSNGDIEVLDVRAPHEFAAGHLPNAINIPLTHLFEEMKNVPQSGKQLLIACRSGGRSFVAATILRSHGIKNIINLDGGFLAWTKSRLPSEK